MAVVRKINGVVVTEKQWEQHFRRRERIFGKPRWGAPAIRTNETWMRNKKHRDPDIDDPSLQVYAKRAEAAGVSTSGKFLLESLMDSPDDHQCWVGSDADAIALAKTKKALIEINGNVHDFRDKYRDPKPPEPYRVADHIVDDDLHERTKSNPNLTPAELAKMREDIRREITPTNIKP